MVSTWTGCPGGYQTFPVRRARHTVGICADASLTFRELLSVLVPIIKQIFGNIWNHGENLDLLGQNHWKILDRCNIWPFFRIYMD